MGKTYREILEGGSESFRRLNASVTQPVWPPPGEKPRLADPLAPAVPNPEPESDLRQTLEHLPEAQSGSQGAPLQRIRVEITLFRVNLLDTDNKWGSVKPLLDCIREAGLIPNDRECDIALNVTQVQVGSFRKEGTGIRLVYREPGSSWLGEKSSQPPQAT